MNTHLGIGVTAEGREALPYVPLPSAGRPVGEPAVRPRFATRRWALVGIATLLLATSLGIWWSFSGSAPVGYETAPVAIGDIARDINATGSVNPELTIIVGTYVSGVIQELSCDYNTQVKRGQSCAKIDPRPYQSIVDQAKASLAIAKAQLEKDKASLTYAKANLERLATLVKTSAVSEDAYDNAKNVYDQALAQITFDEATIQQRQAVLDAAQVNLDYTNIVSPVDGTVVSRAVTMGQTVAASFQTPTLFLIATDLTRMQVDANVSESDIGGIQTGNNATFTVDAYPKRLFEGTVTQVRQSPQTVQNVITYDVVISVNNADLALKPGLTAATRIVTDRRNDVLRIPNQALRYVPTGTALGDTKQARVWVLRDGSSVPVPVAVGLDDDEFTEIVQGDLKVSDRVIVAEQRNSAKARSGMPPPRL
ncbi:efflux RND transporter periplasmic adaptor subunit [Bradyrhizobium barranii subsp. apii]|uniref:Efflux RND transporter periplasmic adaptor subunit n=1 Tax=Bradyrhizobium barranii subsp. apii TaxID=2819348 RepID=A0A8T5UTN2_9BRAD|nr:efflux RND transporter periplasmic adaptor subunit [Bradyrhizobium barranii]UPT88188.1 efflux RND transporter periplasmic adaptor subunit [Bradyrhizobium barranii subsp. apii]